MCLERTGCDIYNRFDALLKFSSSAMTKNSFNTISSFSSLLGPVLGGVLYSTYGLAPVLWVCIVCFFLSAVMELFIEIPYQKQASDGSIWKMAGRDFAESIRFIHKDKPVIEKVLLAVCGINLFLSAMINVGMPYMITEVLDLGGQQANELYGFTEGALAAGGLAGGIRTGILAGRLVIRHAGNLLAVCVLCVFPMGMAPLFFTSGLINYAVMTVCCFMIMVCSTMFTVQMMSFVQAETPQHLIGKVIAVILTVSMCAQPLGNAMYGILFELCKGFEAAVILFTGGVSLLIAVSTKNVFKSLSFTTPQE